MNPSKILLFAMLGLAACGGGETPPPEEPKAEEPKAEEPKAEEPKAEEPKAESPNIVTYEDGVAMVALEGTDQMKFKSP